MAQNATELTLVLKAKDAMSSALKKAEGQIQKLSAGVKKYENEIRVASKAALGLAVIGGALFTSAIVQAADFEQSIANVSAVTKASIEDQKRLADAALEMGSKSVFSASQAAEAQLALGQAGQTTTQIIQSLEGVMSLAAATSSDLGFAAEVTTASLSQFGLEADQANRIANLFAASTSASPATLEKLSSAMRQVGPVANSLNFSIEETTATLNLLFNAGFKGEQSGTILRGALTSLIKPSTEAAETISRLGVNLLDTAGKMKKPVELLRELEKANLSTADAVTIFGQEAGPGMLDLISQGSKALEDMKQKITGTDEASRQAAVRMNTLQGSIKELSSAWEGANITVGTEFIPVIRFVAKILTSLVLGFNEMDPLIRSVLAGLSLLVSVVAGLAGGFGLLATAIATSKRAFGVIGVSSALLGKGFLLLTGFITAMVAAYKFGETIAGLKAVQHVVVEFVRFVENAWLGIQFVFFNVLKAFGKIQKFVSELIREYTPGLERFFSALVEMELLDVNPFDAMSEGLKELDAIADFALNNIADATNAANAEYQKMHEEIDALPDSLEKTAEAIKKTNDATKAATQSATEQAKAHEEAARAATEYAESLGKLEAVELKVLEAQQKATEESLKLVRERGAAIKQILDIDSSIKAFEQQLGEKGLTREEKDVNELIRQQERFSAVVLQGKNAEKDARRQLRDMGVSEDQREAVLETIRKRQALEQVEALQEISNKTKELALAAEQGSLQESNARNLVLESSEKLKKAMGELAVIQGTLDSATVKNSKTLESAYIKSLHQVDQLQTRFDELAKQIKEIEARIVLADREKVIAQADHLRQSLVARFANPIHQKVIIESVEVLSSAQRSSGLSVNRTSGGISLSDTPKFASGIRSVPRDNFPALLHKGEQVLTRSEAKERQDQMVTVTIGDINVYASDSSQAPEIVAERIYDELNRIKYMKGDN